MGEMGTELKIHISPKYCLWEFVIVCSKNVLGIRYMAYTYSLRYVQLTEFV